MSITWVPKYLKQYLCTTLLSRYYGSVSAFLSHANLFLGKEGSLSEDCSLSLHGSGGDLLFPIITACTLDFLGSLPSSSHFCHRRQKFTRSMYFPFLRSNYFPQSPGNPAHCQLLGACMHIHVCGCVCPTVTSKGKCVKQRRRLFAPLPGTLAKRFP